MTHDANQGTLGAVPPATTHVYPVNDLHPHEIDGARCPCQPATETIRDDDGTFCGRMVVHNAWDKREQHEYDHKAHSPHRAAAGPS